MYLTSQEIEELIKAFQKSNCPFSEEQEQCLSKFAVPINNDLEKECPELKNHIIQHTASQIKYILNKYNLGGTVGIFSQSEALALHFFPNWSLLQLDKDTNELVFDSNPNAFDSEKEHIRTVKATIGMISAMSNISGRFYTSCHNVKDQLLQQLDPKDCSSIFSKDDD